MEAIATQQQEMNPADKDYTNLILEMSKNQKQAQRGNQAYLGDWLNIPNIVEYVSLTGIQGIVKFSNTNIDPRSFFAIGTPIRYKQGGAFKYAYVTAVTSTNFTINSGTTHTLLNATITDFGKGLISTPTGFPVVFDYNPNPRGAGIVVLSGMSNVSYKFWMVGPICHIDLHFDGASMTNGPTSSLFMSTPIQPANLGNGVPTYNIVVVNNFQLQTGLAKINGINTDIEMQIIEFPGGGGSGFGAWQTSTNGHFVDLTFPYLIQT